MVRILEEMEEYAKINNIPIMEKEGIEFITEYIKNNDIKKILEIGSAIGYSAIKMAILDEDIKIITIERDQKRFEEAVKNIKKVNLENQIEIHNCDAFDFETNEKFDLIFIDAAKSQYIKFFQKFEINLQANGTIISDNLNFHGLTHKLETIKSRNVRGIVRKLNNYIEFLKENPKYETKFLDIGDGIGISKKRK